MHDGRAVLFAVAELLVTVILISDRLALNVYSTSAVT